MDNIGAWIVIILLLVAFLVLYFWLISWIAEKVNLSPTVVFIIGLVPILGQIAVIVLFVMALMNIEVVKRAPDAQSIGDAATPSAKVAPSPADATPKVALSTADATADATPRDEMVA